MKFNIKKWSGMKIFSSLLYITAWSLGFFFFSWKLVLVLFLIAWATNLERSANKFEE